MFETLAGSGSPEKNKIKKPAPAPTPAAAASSGKDISAFLRYMERKDEQDRNMRQQELDLRREELELHKKELELQKERFDYDRLERQAHLDLLKMQLDVLAGPKARQIITDNKVIDNAVTEYTIVVNNDQAFAAQ